MKDRVPELLKNHRVTSGKLASDPSFGMTGMFVIPRKRIIPSTPMTREDIEIRCLSDDGRATGYEQPATEWEHVSVVTLDRNGETAKPSWDEMAAVKHLFWPVDEQVIQYHPREEDYVNIHDDALHLWRPLEKEIPAPPTQLLGPVTGAK